MGHTRVPCPVSRREILHSRAMRQAAFPYMVQLNFLRSQCSNWAIGWHDRKPERVSTFGSVSTSHADGCTAGYVCFPGPREVGLSAVRNNSIERPVQHTPPVKLCCHCKSKSLRFDHCGHFQMKCPRKERHNLKLTTMIRSQHAQTTGIIQTK